MATPGIMVMQFLLVCALAQAVVSASVSGGQSDPSVDEPLFLTKFIQDGRLHEAKQLAKVGVLNGANVPSYSGFLTVNKTTESNLFFWFFPALEHAQDAPVLLWLQGGPASSSLFGLFVEHGPYEVTIERKIRLRNTTWVKQFNVLYIDQPVGAGFSFTNSDAAYPKNEYDVSRDLFEALQQFFTLFQEYSKNDFYITGESYGGKFVPAIAYKIHQNLKTAKMNLKGIAIGDGVCDPVTMLQYADFLLQIGLIDKKQAAYLYQEQNRTLEYLKKGDLKKAFMTFDRLVRGSPGAGTSSYLHRVTGLQNIYNFITTIQPADFSYNLEFIDTSQTRKAIHVGNIDYTPVSYVTQAGLQEDFMRSTKPWIAELMNKYKVLIYTGQLDIIVPASLTATFVNSIEWDGAKELADADRIIWRSPQTGFPSGYVRQVRNFTEVMVRNAGHMVPHDQPENTYDMMYRFIYDQPFN